MILNLYSIFVYLEFLKFHQCKKIIHLHTLHILIIDIVSLRSSCALFILLSLVVTNNECIGVNILPIDL